ncbi:MAG TPA: hypothetical protein VEH29_00220 [Acidimicrobiales bacterium]|nr:hypothetical protein [Acidimicrobiales bacterium]
MDTGTEAVDVARAPAGDLDSTDTSPRPGPENSDRAGTGDDDGLAPDGAATPAAAEPGPAQAIGRGRLAVAVCILAYLGLGVLANLPSWTGGVTHTMQCGACGDSGQEVWFLAWAAHAVTHLQDPLRTNWINYPWGVDLADNTSMPLAGVLGTPITLLFGPVATFNVLFSLAFAGSASAAFFLLRRFTTWTLAAFAGGLLYGFSPYMIGQGEGHLFLLLVPVPPLALLVLDEILVRQHKRWWLMGCALGLLMIVQLGWSAEMLILATTVACSGVVVLALARPRLIRRQLPYAAKAVALGVLLLAPAALWFAVVSRTGPEHLPGPVHSVKALAGLSTDLAGLVVPSVNQHFSFGLAGTGTSFVRLASSPGPSTVDPAEDGSYVGIPILLLLGVGVYRFRRDGLVRFAAVMAGLSLLLSMGSRLRVWGHDTGIPLPFVVLTKLPFVQSEVASRYCVFMWLFIALAVGLILDHARNLEPAGRKRHSSRGPAPPRRRGPLGAFLILAVLGVVSLVPGWPYNIGQVFTPAALEAPAVDVVPVGSTLLTYPLARGNHNLPMVWQALDRFRYRIPAGEEAVRNKHAGPLEAAFNSCWNYPTEEMPGGHRVGLARAEFVLWRVRTVVIPFADSMNPNCAIRFVEDVVGRSPVIEGGAAVWTKVSVRIAAAP